MNPSTKHIDRGYAFNLLHINSSTILFVSIFLEDQTQSLVGVNVTEEVPLVTRKNPKKTFSDMKKSKGTNLLIFFKLPTFKI